MRSFRWSLAGLLLLVSAPASSAPPRVDARLSCRAESSPGRVLCELEVEAASGSVPWADALVVEAPEFAPPLRSRVGPTQATARTERRTRLPLALAATRNGRGQLIVSARWVICGDASGRDCNSGTTRATAPVRVGVEAE